jgi:Family of unknown function (DUF6781)
MSNMDFFKGVTTMSNENNNATDNTNSAPENTPNTKDIETLEAEIHDAVAQGSNVEEAVQHLTLKAMNASRLDIDSLRRIINAVMRGAREGAHQKLEHANDQSQTAQKQISNAVAGLDSALASFAEASKLAVEEAASRAKKFSDTELAQTRSDLESLETMFLDTLHDTASTAKGLVADTLHDLASHAKRNGTAVGEQLKLTLATLAQQMSSVSHAQLEAGFKLAQSTAGFISKAAAGVLASLEDRKKTSDQPKDT